jgi:hypothetical protein
MLGRRTTSHGRGPLLRYQPFGLRLGLRLGQNFFARENRHFACQNGERGRHRGRRLVICQGQSEVIANLVNN